MFHATSDHVTAAGDRANSPIPFTMAPLTTAGSAKRHTSAPVPRLKTLNPAAIGESLIDRNNV
jgi:hypothetical protein